ncbi:MAG: hypothetical protein KDI83_06790 [Gammaproteobacteria bacterium]|nr:hypothetical protein [Gammaproteobacteria bacterium]MCP5416904.1 hypothetical protein [Chromatiaceae bacterium]
MSRENDRISTKVACIDIERLPATLISTRGAHCKVFQTGGYLRRKRAPVKSFVVKTHKLRCEKREAEIYFRDYRKLRKLLEEMIPKAVFVRTLINGEHNLVVIAYQHVPWFNIANPANEAEALPLLGKSRKAYCQLELFVSVAKELRRKESKVIDLYGLDNLVLDRDRQIRYLDSFEVFFYEDMLHLMDGAGRELEEKISISLQRLDYLDYLVQQNSRSC